MRWVVAACGAASFLLLAVPASAQDAATTAPSPNPSATPAAMKLPDPFVSIEEEYSPNYDGEGVGSSGLNFRGQTAFASGGYGYLIRLKVPYVSSAPPGAITGRGNTTLAALQIRSDSRGQWLVGITMRLPTAQNDSLGSPKQDR